MQSTPHESPKKQSSKRQKATNAAILGTAGMLIAGVGVALAQSNRVEAANAEAVAAYTSQAFPTTAAVAPAVELDLPSNPSVLLLGDSFAQGYGAEPRSEGYAYVLGEKTGWEDVTVDHEGRTGFVADNKGMGTAYPERVRNHIESGGEAPDLVILQGSINDTSATNDEMRRAVTDAVDSINNAWPDTAIAVTAPISYRSFARIESAMVNALSDKGVVYLDDGTPRAWLPHSTNLYAEDTWHPSTEGHSRIAATMAEALLARMD